MSAKKAHWFRNILYNQEFGLYDHFGPNSKNEAFAVVRAFPQEDFIRETHLQDVCLRYHENGIYEYFKLSLLEYMRMPMPYSRALDKIATTNIRPQDNARKERENKKYMEGFNFPKSE